MSKPYFKLKTGVVMVNKAALPEPERKPGEIILMIIKKAAKKAALNNV